MTTPTLTQAQTDDIAYYLDADLCERLHRPDLSPREWLAEALRVDWEDVRDAALLAGVIVVSDGDHGAADAALTALSEVAS